MGNFEKLSVLVIVVIIVMILVVALYTWSDNPGDTPGGEPPVARVVDNVSGGGLPGSGLNGSPAPGPGASESSPSPSTILEEWEREFGEENRGDPGEPGASRGEAGAEEPKLPEPSQADPLPKPDVKPLPAVQENWMYTVKGGDTLTEIAERELGTWRRYPEILKLNAGVKAETIREGMTLKMPPKVMASSEQGAPAADGKGKPETSSIRGGKIPVGESYVIQRGDRLSRIAKRAYGSIDRWPELWARNLSVISDPDEPPVGAQIFIPK